MSRIAPSSTPETELIAKQIYHNSKLFFSQLPALRENNLTYEILLGPPFFRPPIAFIGYQPGDGPLPPEESKQYEDSWVDPFCHYAKADWPLARELRKVYSVNFLHRCVGMNAIFVRSSNATSYRKSLSSASVRNTVASFCVDQVATLIQALHPENIVIIGRDAAKLLPFDTTHTQYTVRNDKQYPLWLAGSLWKRPAIAVTHLTGAPLFKAERELIYNELRRRSPEMN